MQFTMFQNEEEAKVGQENEDDVVAFSRDLLADAVLWATDWTTETIISQLKKKNIELSPSFQRRDAWGEDRKSGFIESCILGLPIPQIILAERKDKKGSYLVIDGKQRLLSLRQFCVTEEGDTFTALKLKNLKVLSNLNNSTYREIADDPQLADFHTAFENQSIRTVIIKNWPNQDFLYTVFLRLNTGSLPLSPQELRQALNPGPFTSFADEYSIGSVGIKKVLKLEKPDYRMRDVEIVVRFFSFKNYIESYNGKLKEFLDATCDKLNTKWNDGADEIKKQAESLEQAISATYEIFGENAFSKYSGEAFTNMFNRPVYDIMTYYFSDSDIRNKCLEKPEEVIDSFISRCVHDGLFLASFESSTKDINRTCHRYNVWGNELRKITGLKFQIPTRTDAGIKLA